MEFKLLDSYLLDFLYPPQISEERNNCCRGFSRHGYNVKDIEIISFDNILIKGHLFTSKKTDINTSICVIYTHSHGSNKHEGLQLFEACRDKNYSLFVYDSRGCGSSTKTNITFGNNEKIDLLYCLYYLTITEEIVSYILWGRSMGSCAIIQMLYDIQNDPDKQSRPVFNIDQTKTTEIVYSDFFHKNYSLFLNKNRNITMLKDKLNIVIAGVVLDSPISSVRVAINNFIKSKIININLVAKYASNYATSFLNKHTNMNIDNRQNINLIKSIRSNIFILFSINDEFVSKEDENMIIKNFMADAEIKGYMEYKHIELSHKAKRHKDLIGNIFEKLKLNFNKLNFIEYFELKNIFDIKNINEKLQINSVSAKNKVLSDICDKNYLNKDILAQSVSDLRSDSKLFEDKKYSNTWIPSISLNNLDNGKSNILENRIEEDCIKSNKTSIKSIHNITPGKKQDFQNSNNIGINDNTFQKNTNKALSNIGFNNSNKKNHNEKRVLDYKGSIQNFKSPMSMKQQTISNKKPQMKNIDYDSFRNTVVINQLYNAKNTCYMNQDKVIDRTRERFTVGQNQNIESYYIQGGYKTKIKETSNNSQVLNGNTIDSNNLKRSFNTANFNKSPFLSLKHEKDNVNTDLLMFQNYSSNNNKYDSSKVQQLHRNIKEKSDLSKY